jgi:hypothetical protein
VAAGAELRFRTGDPRLVEAADHGADAMDGSHHHDGMTQP